MMTADGDVPAELSKLQKGYELLGELIRDDTLTVYVARDRLSGNEVAIKVLRAADARGREALAHYASDARLLTALEHPNIVAVHAVKWLTEDVVAVITERVRGPSLRQVLDVAGTLPVTRATEVLRGLGRALAWAHSSQIMHRDLRPENVTFEDRSGRVVLSDFGLARRIEGAVTAAAPAADAYRAPELADGRYPDRRSDVYSLGIVGWELLTGRRPWPDTMEPIEPGQGAPDPPPLAEIRPGLHAALVAAIEGAVQLDRDRRIPDVATFMERLTHVAPPQPEAEDEATDESWISAQPTEWVALPVPRIPRKRQPDQGEREIERLTEREVTRSVERDVQPAPSQSFAPPPASESEPAAVEEAATLATPVGPTPSQITPDPARDSKRRRRKRERASRDALPPVSPAPGAERAADVPVQTTPAETIVAASKPEAAPPVPEATEPPTPTQDTSTPSSFVPTDVELPPPEPVPFADLLSEPLRGPIFGSGRGSTRGSTRESTWFGGMRGGLGGSRGKKGTSHGPDPSAGPPAPAPLQPMWDTPAEFPLPAMPDPRPMPADLRAGAETVTPSPWTRRRMSIAAGALLILVAAVALARMQRGPDTTARLMEPEIPAGYGGDVMLTPDTSSEDAQRSGDDGDAGATTDARTSAAPARRRAASPPPAAPPAARRTPAATATPNTATRSTATPAAGRTAPPEAAPATASRPQPASPCESPAAADQRTCLAAAIERNDAGLNQIYGAVVTAMRERANSAPADPDPPEVQRLRAAQRAWLARRDAECRRRGRGREGPLWATSRAECLAEFSTNRLRELSATLARLRRD